MHGQHKNCYSSIQALVISFQNPEMSCKNKNKTFGMTLPKKAFDLNRPPMKGSLKETFAVVSVITMLPWEGSGHVQKKKKRKYVLLIITININHIYFKCM